MSVDRLFDVILTDAGWGCSFLLLCLVVTNVFWFRLHRAEQVDRKAAWAAHGTAMERGLTVLSRLEGLIQQLVNRGRH